MKKKIFFTMVFSLLIVSFFMQDFAFAEEIDITPPAISLIGDLIINLNIGDSYEDAGATALDNGITDLTSDIEISNSVDTSVAGTYTITYDVLDNAGNNAIQVSRVVNVKEIDTSSSEISTENVIIRNGDTVIYNGVVPLLDEEEIGITDDAGVVHMVSSDSILGMLYSLSITPESTFSLSGLSYYDSMGFMLKCLTPKDQDELCNNWQYVVDGVAPWDSIDNKILSGGESIGIYFGYPYRLLLDSISIIQGESLVATAQKYDSTLGLWNPLTDISIRVTEPNPDDPWSPIVVASQNINFNSEAIIPLLNSGTYNVDISDSFGNYYYIQTYIITVNSENSNGGGSGGSHNNTKEFSLDDAISFLLNNQNDDGSFSNSLYTDWVAIGVAEAGDDADELKSKLKSYLKNEDFKALSVTDYERHAMALMALGINPYTGTDVNYIQKIVDSFDGEQIGDESLFNDDIFGLIVLQNAGYNKDDEIILKTVSYIISQQSPNGSWGSVDMTAAGIEALYNLKDLDNVSDSISKAFGYLINSQSIDGGFENSSSTSWAIQAMSLDNSFYDAEIDNALGYLALKQQNDGGVIEMATDSIDTRIWETAYVIPAVLKMPWKDIINSFTKIETQTSSDQKLDETEEGKITRGIETQIISENQVLTIQKTSEIVLPEIKKVSNPKVVVKDTTPEKKTVDIPEPSNNVDLDNNLLASAGSVNLGNFFKDKVIIMTIILTLVTFIGGWFVIKS